MCACLDAISAGKGAFHAKPASFDVSAPHFFPGFPRARNRASSEGYSKLDLSVNMACRVFWPGYAFSVEVCLLGLSVCCILFSSFSTEFGRMEHYVLSEAVNTIWKAKEF